MTRIYGELDPGIRDTVQFLRNGGFNTTDSGDGVSKEGGPLESSMLKVPHVVISVLPSQAMYQADMLLAFLDMHGISAGPDEATVTELAGAQAEGTVYGDNVFITASYDPQTKVSIIMVTGLDDALLASKRDQKQKGDSCSL